MSGLGMAASASNLDTSLLHDRRRCGDTTEACERGAGSLQPPLDFRGVEEVGADAPPDAGETGGDVQAMLQRRDPLRDGVSIKEGTRQREPLPVRNESHQV